MQPCRGSMHASVGSMQACAIGRRPAPDRRRPAPDRTPPAPDRTPPATDRCWPAPDHTPPATDRTPPAPDRTPPAPDRTPPAPDRTPPAADRAWPAPDRAWPAPDRPCRAEDRRPRPPRWRRAGPVQCDPRGPPLQVAWRVDPAPSVARHHQVEGPEVVEQRAPTLAGEEPRARCAAARASGDRGLEDVAQLRRWLVRAVTAASAEEAIDEA